MLRPTHLTPMASALSETTELEPDHKCRLTVCAALGGVRSKELELDHKGQLTVWTALVFVHSKELELDHKCCLCALAAHALVATTDLELGPMQRLAAVAATNRLAPDLGQPLALLQQSPGLHCAQ